MVIRVLAVPDYLDLASFDEAFRSLLGWDGLGFSFHIHGQEFTSFLRRSKVHRTRLHDFQLRPRETFLYTCGGLDLWEWEFRVLACEAGDRGDDAPVCLAGRGASPPEFCGGPTGYRLMLKRQKEGDLAQMKAEHAKANADRKAKLQEKIDQLATKIQAQLEKAKERDEASLREAKAKAEVLKAKATAKAKVKAS